MREFFLTRADEMVFWMALIECNVSKPGRSRAPHALLLRALQESAEQEVTGIYITLVSSPTSKLLAP